MASTPPPVLPVLTTRTRFSGKVYRHPSLTIRQRYRPYPSRSDVLPPSPYIPNFLPGDFMTFVRHILPNPKPTPTESAVSAPNSKDTSLSAQTQASDLLVMTQMQNCVTPPVSAIPKKRVMENDGLIPKPVGEAGRRVGGRGYNVETVLQWPDADVENMKVKSGRPHPRVSSLHQQRYVQQLSDQHLDLGNSFKNQNQHALLAIVDAVSLFWS